MSSLYATSMELGHQSHDADGLLGPHSRMVVYVEPLGYTVDDRNPALP